MRQVGVGLAPAHLMVHKLPARRWLVGAVLTPSPDNTGHAQIIRLTSALFRTSSLDCFADATR